MAELIRSTKKSCNAEELPELNEECIYEIFCHFPAADIEASVKCLSKSWLKTVYEPSFIEKHLSNSKPGLLLQNNACTRFGRIRHFTIEKGVFKVTNVDCCRRMYSPRGGSVLASCDGVSVVHLTDKRFNHGRLCVANILKRRLLEMLLPSDATLLTPFCGIGRVPQTGEFKVLCPFIYNQKGFRWCVTTIGGADLSWREIDLPVDLTYPLLNNRQVDIISCSGVIYFDRSCAAHHHTTFAVDLSDETVHRIQVPSYNPPAPSVHEIIIDGVFGRPMDQEFLVMRSHDDDYFLPLDGRFVVMGDKVSFIAPEQQGANEAQLRMYILADFRNSRWEICNKFIHPKIHSAYIKENAVPIAWLDDAEVLICRVRREKKVHQAHSWYAYGLVAYYVKTGKRKALPSAEVCRTHTVTCHTESLVMWF